MVYYKVNKDYNGIKILSKRNLYLISGELFTKKEIEKLKIFAIDKVFTKIETSKNNTYFSFGARFEKKIITQQTDANLENCTAILLNDGTFVKLGFDYDSNEFRIYEFDVIKNTSFHDWINLDGINSYSDTNYKLDQELSEIEAFNFTNDVCSYYGAFEFDYSPAIVEFDNLEYYINGIL